MIRVNLLRNLAGAGAAARAPAGSSAAFDAPVMTMEDVKKQAAVKLVAILLFPIGVFAFQYLQAANEAQELAELRAKREKVDAEKAKLGDAAPKVAKHEAAKKKLKEELSVLEDLSRDRLREVKALDAIQNLMPKDTWLSKVAIDGSNVSLTGYSKDTGHTDLLAQLEESGLFREVDPRSTLQEESPYGAVKRFQIDFRIGRPERQKN